MVIAAVLYFVLKPSEGNSEKIVLPTVTEKPEIPVCQTPQCISLAHQLLNWRDDKVNPCDDFYQYTCGKYAEHVNSEYPTIQWKSQLMYGTISEHINRIKNSTQKKSEQAMKKVYDHCRNTRQGISKFWDQESLKSLSDKIALVGEFPIFGTFNVTAFDVNDYLFNMASVFKTYNFGLFKIRIIQGFLVIEQEEYQDLSSAIETLRKLLSYKGLPTTLSTYRSEMQDFIQNELKTDGSPNVIKMSVTDLYAKFQKLDCSRILQNLMTAKQLQHFDDKLFVDESMKTSQSGNRDALVDTGDKWKLANFLLLNILINANRVAIADARCSQKVVGLAPHLSLGIMIRHYFDKKNLKKASDLVEEMIAAFRKMLQASTWLQDSTKTSAVTKLEKMKRVIGYTEEFDDPEKFETVFEAEVNLSGADSYYTLCFELDTFTRRMILEELASDRAVATTEDVTRANAFYAPMLNLMMLNVPILDDPLFDASFPKYAQIGSMGYIVGHEIGHAFDPKGSKYDENGNYRDWWTSQDKTEFSRRTQCVINKYENYDDPSFGRNRLNGTSTVGENVADILGSRVSWDIYKNVDVAKEPRLVGLQDHNIDKLFFQILAMKWCAPYNTETLDNQLKDTHGVDNYRVNGVFSNMKQFAETFNCPVGSKMNPATKCDLF